MMKHQINKKLEYIVFSGNLGATTNEYSCLVN